MEAHIEYDVVTDETRLYIVERGMDVVRRFYTLKDGELVVQRHEPGQVIQPFMRMGQQGWEILKVIAAKVTNAAPADEGAREHLKDAREVRDRLLKMVEKVWEEGR